VNLADLPFAAHIEHAYTPRETGTHGGGDHIVVDESVTIGRIRRDARATLCRKDRYSFWGLSRGGEDDTPNCKRCIEIAERVVEPTGDGGQQQ